MITRICAENRDSAMRSGQGGTWANLALMISAAILLVAAGGTAAAAPMNNVPFLPAQGSTAPANGDLNPYGLALVPHLFPSGGIIHGGQLLVSNFNNSMADGNLQGEGRTIVIIDPDTAQQVGLFFQGAHNIGFTNALTVLRAGFVLGGSVFTENSTSAAKPGGLLVFDRNGNLVTTILTAIGPWGLAANDQGGMAQLFVSDVLGGTITRLEVSLKGGAFAVVSTPVTIGSGYAFGPDSAGLVVGPAGLVYNANSDTLYVAAEDDNAIYAIDDAASRLTSAGKGTLVYADDNHLHGPLGLMMAPNGDFVTANADPAAHVDPAQTSELVEFTPGGQFVRQYSIDPNNGSAFAILNVRRAHANSFAYVDDFSSTLSILELTPF
jgi:DNA-binding beta-propeller fold protein YncE